MCLFSSYLIHPADSPNQGRTHPHGHSGVLVNRFVLGPLLFILLQHLQASTYGAN